MEELTVTNGPMNVQVVHKWSKYERLPGGLRLQCTTANGTNVVIIVTFPLPAVMRLQMAPGRIEERESEMLVLRGEQAVGLNVRSTEDGLVLRTADLQVHIGRDPWYLQVLNPDGNEVFAQHITDRASEGEWEALPFGWTEVEPGRLAMRETFCLLPDEGFFGLGGHGGPLNRRGQTIRCAVEPGCGASSRQASKAIPFVWSTRGYGLLVHSYGAVTFELGTCSAASCTVTVDDNQLDYFLIYGPTPAEILRRYGELTGFAAVPPPWAFGFWISGSGSTDQGAVEETCATMRARHIPCDVVHIENPWAGGCSLDWDRDVFPSPEQLASELREIGFRISASVSPYIPAGTPFYREGLSRGFLVQGSDGQPLLRRRGRTGQEALVDLTLPTACAWWQTRMYETMVAGVSALVAVECADAPLEGIYHDGTPGRWIRGRYALLYQETVNKAAVQALGDNGLVFTTTTWAGTQRLAVPWSEATGCSPGHMMAQLREGLNLALSGVTLWAPGIGSSQEAAELSLFVRWCQLGFLSAIARLRSDASYEFLTLGSKAESVLREYARLRSSLAPYIYSSAVGSVRNGLPLMRPLVLAYPQDRNTWWLDQQYLLGEEILVAAAWDADAEIEVYLPAGVWIDYWSGARLQGPAWVHYRAALERLPLFVKAGAIIPTQAPVHFVEEREPEELILKVYPQENGRFVLYDARGKAHELALAVVGGKLELRLPAFKAQVTVLLHGVPAPIAVTVDGLPVACEWSAGKAAIRLERGRSLIYEAREALNGE